MRLIYHPSAEAEVVEATRYYEAKDAGLGERFLQEYEAAVVRIVEAPDRWKIVEVDLRRHLLSQFPYGIYYRLEGDEIRILVVKHHSRHPAYWRDRLKD
jgi:toxin ParE1/3/4